MLENLYLKTEDFLSLKNRFYPTKIKKFTIITGLFQNPISTNPILHNPPFYLHPDK